MPAVKGTYSRTDMALAPQKIETDRLVLRHMDLDRDMDALLTLRLDPQVMRYIGLPKLASRAEAQHEAAEKNKKGDYKFFYAMTDRAKADDQMIGLVIMRPMPDGDGIEVGYWLMPDHWGSGLTTEATRAVCAACPPAMGFPRKDITAHVMVGNQASRRVLEKAGLAVTDIRTLDLPTGGTVDVWWFDWAG